MLFIRREDLAIATGLLLAGLLVMGFIYRRMFK